MGPYRFSSTKTCIEYFGKNESRQYLCVMCCYNYRIIGIWQAGTENHTGPNTKQFTAHIWPDTVWTFFCGTGQATFCLLLAFGVITPASDAPRRQPQVAAGGHALRRAAPNRPAYKLVSWAEAHSLDRQETAVDQSDATQLPCTTRDHARR